MEVDIDITQRLQEKIRSLEAKTRLYEQIIEYAPVSIFVRDLNNVNIMVNQRVREILNMSTPELIGKTNEEIFNDKTFEKIHQIDQKVLKEGKIITNEEKLEINGQVREFIATRGPYYAGDTGKIAGIFGVSQEITRLKKIEALEEKQEQMNIMNTMLMGLSHDINNFIHIIISQASLLTELVDNSEALGVANKIIQTAEVSSNLFKSLQLQTRKLTEQDLSIVDFNDIIQTILDMLYLDQYPHIDFRIDLSDSVWEVKSNRNHLIQIGMNLVLNAIEAMPDGGVLSVDTFNLDLNDELPFEYLGIENGKYICLKIEDTGAGMSPHVLSRIFTPYYSTKMGRNSGLGLYNTYNLVKLFGGEIIISTELGKGSTFQVLLPIG